VDTDALVDVLGEAENVGPAEELTEGLGPADCVVDTDALADVLGEEEIVGPAEELTETLDVEVCDAEPDTEGEPL
jgi:hypothetical protein